MYRPLSSGSGLLKSGGAGGTLGGLGGTLAFTGFHLVGFLIAAVTLFVFGLSLVHLARRPKDAPLPPE